MAFKKPATAAKKAAAKKTTAKAAPTWAKVQLPAGFRAITSGAHGQEWEYEKNPLLQGAVTSDVREIESGTGKNKRTSRVVTVKSSDDGVSYTLWESASLRAFFDHVHKGMEVAVVFQGYRDVGKPQPMKVFEGAFTDDDAAELDLGNGDDGEPTPARRPAAKKAAAKKTRR